MSRRSWIASKAALVLKKDETQQLSNSMSISSATLWSLLEFALGRGLNIIIIVVLARLLTPADFGTYALLAVFLGVATTLIESGFGLALIHKQDTTDDDNSTVFWISLVTATIITFALVVAAPQISAFFDLPVLVQLTHIMAVTVWISGFGVVQRALLVKRLAFRQLTIINLSAVLLSSLLAVALASAGFGVFALAWQGMASALVTSCLLWLLNGWRPTVVYNHSSAKRLFGFGGYLLASNLLEVVYSKSYTLLIGKFFGTVELGQFNRAESTGQLVSGVVVYPISRVAFPAFSQMREDLVRIRGGLQDAVRISMLCNAVAMFTLAAIAKPFVLTIFGPQWEPSVRFLQVLCLGYVLMPLQVLNLQALVALGRSDLFFLLEVIKKTIGVAILVLASRYGAIGIAWGIVVAGVISFVINAWYSGKILDYGPLRQAGQVLPSLGFGLLAAGTAKVAMAISGLESQIFLSLIGIGASAATSLVILGSAWLLGYDLAGLLSRVRTKSDIAETGSPS